MLASSAFDRPEAPTLLCVICEDPLVRRMLCTLLDAEGLSAQGSPVAPAPGAEWDAWLWDLGAEDSRTGPALDALALASAPVLALVPGAEAGRAALARGARGAVGREAPGPVLAAAVRSVLLGLTVLDAPVAALLAESALVVRDSAVPDEPDAVLTPREREVLALVAEGLSNKLVAARLGISERTVKFHVNALMARLGAQSRTEAVVRAARRGLLAL